MILLSLTLAGILISFRRNDLEWNVYQALVFILLAAALRRKLEWTWVFVPLSAIAAWPALQLAAGVTVYRNATIIDLLRWTTYAAIFAIGFWSFRHRDEIQLLLRVLIVYSLCLAALSTMQHFAGNGKVFWLFTAHDPIDMGPFLNRDHYASYMVLIIPMALLRAFDEPKRRLTYILAAAAMYASVVAGQSRAGSLLVTAEVLLCLAVITMRATSQRHRVPLASAFLIAALVAVVGWEPLWNRLVDDKDPYRGRRELALASMAMIRERPLTGYGAGTWTSVYPAHALMDPGLFANAAHNDWLQWTADGGIPFAALFLGLFCVSLVVCWTVPWAMGIPAVFIHCLVDFPISDGRYFPAIFFLIFGAAVARANVKRRTDLRTAWSKAEIPAALQH